MLLHRADLTGLSNRLDTHLVVLLNPALGNASENDRSNTSHIEVVVDWNRSDSAILWFEVRLCCGTL